MKTKYLIVSNDYLKLIPFDREDAEDETVREAKKLLIGGTVMKVGTWNGIPVYLDENMACRDIIRCYTKE